MNKSKKSEIEKALDFAIAAHKGQERRYTRESYVVHPIRVAQTLNKYPQIPVEVVSVALLHDVLEDTNITKKILIEEGFSSTIVDCVELLSNFHTGNRNERKTKYRQQIANIDIDLYRQIVHNVKVADMLDNLPSIIDNDKRFAKVYLRECRIMLGVCEEAVSDLQRKLLGVIYDASLGFLN